MPTKPNQPAYDIAGIRRDTRKELNVPIADDIQADGSATIVTSDCGTCSAYQQERVTVPNAVIMEAVLDPPAGYQSNKLAQLLAQDERITAKTPADPTPHAPSSAWGAHHLMQRAVDMRNQGLIPFSPFHPFVETDGLRSRPEFAEWVEKYTGLMPAAHVDPEAVRSSAGTGETMVAVPAAADGTTAEIVQSGPDITGRHREAGDVVAVDDLPAAGNDDPEQWRSLVADVPTGRDAVLEWVGDDADRARAADAVEGLRHNGRRKTVDAFLAPLLGR